MRDLIDSTETSEHTNLLMYLSLTHVLVQKAKTAGIRLLATSGKDLTPAHDAKESTVSIKITRDGSSNLEPSTGGATGACSIFLTFKNVLEFEIN
jgi:hypothetical protein